MRESMELHAYTLTKKLGESLQAEVYQGFHKDHPNQPLVLKFLKLLSSWEDQSRHLRQKVERLKVLHDPRASTPIALASDAGTQFIVQPWFAGQPLDSWAFRQPALRLEDFFSIACNLADTLQAVHDAGITHGGIKPHNILVQPETLTLRLTDFITPLDIRDVSHFIYDPEFVRGTLAYTSPEQTGRINYRVDFSTDLYSLGIVFYELLTGRLPFFSSDPLELIHSHLAEEAPKAHQVNADLPRQLGEIIAKLVVKQPEKRYQSAAGLLADLIRCRDEYAATRSVSDFPAGLRDHSKRVIFISKMVGRQAESVLIQREYDLVTEGAFRSVFISGFSGIGKTRLIQELQKPLVRHRGYFTSGKFDQYQKNIPYSSLIQALRNLMRVFLTESDAQVARWQSRILQAVGHDGRVITDVVPELEFIIGAQPEVPALPPVEARNRFNNVFGRFLAALASEENPLVLFIDDLQWCDSATFDFFQNIFANHTDYPYLFFMGAYRHNEVDPAHPLTKLIRNILQRKGPIEQIRIDELNPADCHEMVAYILDSSLEETAHLADFITRLTEGNPLFVSESLAWLYNENLLHADDQHQWRWDMQRIRDAQMPTTVVELFSSKVRKLPESTLRILNHCACMGNRFTAEEVSQVLGIRLDQLFEDLKPVLSLGLLLENKSDLQFVHDRVQEAVLRQVDEAERPSIHWRVGNRLLSGISPETDLESLDNLFTIAAHLNRGKPQDADRETIYHLARLNFHAGNKALNALASDAANEFYRIAHDYLPPEGWQQAYELSYRIYQRLAKTELMCGRYEASESLVNQLIEHAESDLDKAEALAEQTTSLSSFGNFNKAIETANRGLAYFDKSISADAAEARSRMQDLMTRIATHQDVWSAILHMPFSSERKSKIELAFYAELIPDLYMSGLVPQLYLSAAQSTLHCLEGGMDESVIYSFSIMGLNLGEQEQFEQAFRYEDLAHDLCVKFPNTFGATRGMNGIVWCNMHSRSHPAAIVEYSHKGIQCGKNCGDLYNAGLSYGPLMWNLQVQGKDLQLVEEMALECLNFSRKNQLSFSIGLAEAVLAGWVAPMKAEPEPTPMAETLARWAEDQYVAASGSYFALLAFARYFMGDYPAAAEALQQVETHLHGMTDNVLKRLWFAFRILNRLRWPEGDAWQNVEAEIQPLLDKIETWSRLGPLLRPYLAFIRAEVARNRGDQREARNLYLDAIAESQAQEYGLLAGHLYECLGDLEQTGGADARARIYHLEAIRLYRQCHAEGKRDRLQRRHPELLDQPVVAEPQPEMQLMQATLPNLDVNYLMKSALALSAEIDLAQLMQKIMSVVLECSGAQHGYLLVREADGLVVVAENHVGKKMPVKRQHYPLEQATGICKAIVHYVFRTRQKVVLRDAGAEGAFQDAPEVTAFGVRSALCLPVMKQSEMIGLLYLENRLSEGIFTAEKSGMTELLTSQVAISLDNARLLEEAQQANMQLRIAATVFQAQEGMLVTDANAVILRVNQAFTDMTGYSEQEAVGRTPRMLSSGRHNRDFYASMWGGLLRHGVWQGEIWNKRKDGSIYPEWLTITAVKGKGGEITHFVSMMTDITERKHAEDEIKHLAFYDPLTHLPNRRLLLDRLQQALVASARNGQDGALLFIDLDNFKALNDTMGHDMGDLLLQQVAERLAICIREVDTVARLGGDEFVVMLEGLSDRPEEAAAQAERVGEKILQGLNQPYLLAGREVHSTPSIGVTLFDEYHNSMDELLKRADIAMYQAKGAGRNALRFFDPGMQAAVTARALLEADLRRALAERQLSLNYQIQVRSDGKVLGAEALVRWHHPLRGMVMPNDFIPLAEEVGLIIPLGQWVLEQACDCLKAWERDPLTHDLELAINVSPRQFREPDFVERVVDTLNVKKVNPARLKLEITESLVLDDHADSIVKMRALRQRGVRFSLDDFGTGYSSLAYLSRFPLDQMKIDRSFVSNIDANKSDAVIVQTIIGMANNLGMQVIAEGVETLNQRNFLEYHGCTLYQGYLFGKPVPGDEFERTLRMALQTCS